jgi:uncharacterized protein (DUF488 family)
MRTHKKHKKQTIFTIGHSTRPLSELVQLLRAHGVHRVIDIRAIPRSRHNPQYNRETLGPALRSNKIGYVHLKALGGLRRTKPDSKNVGWYNASFRGFADYMQTAEFEVALARAIKLSKVKPSVLMCAEALPWRCHRSLVSDALAARKFSVEHIMSVTRANQHKLTSFARVRGKKVTYPSDKPVRRTRTAPKSKRRSKSPTRQ